MVNGASPCALPAVRNCRTRIGNTPAVGSSVPCRTAARRGSGRLGREGGSGPPASAVRGPRGSSRRLPRSVRPRQRGRVGQRPECQDRDPSAVPNRLLLAASCPPCVHAIRSPCRREHPRLTVRIFAERPLLTPPDTRWRSVLLSRRKSEMKPNPVLVLALAVCVPVGLWGVLSPEAWPVPSSASPHGSWKARAGGGCSCARRS